MQKNSLKKIMITFISVFLLVACSKKEVQVGNKTFDTSKNYKIAIAQSAEKQTLDNIRKGFVVGMKDLGFLEDVNVTYIYENARNNKSFAEQIADSFKGKDVDVVVSIGDVASIAMKEKISDLPIVFLGVANAERLGFCDGNGKPLSNMTGVIDSHLIDERLRFISVNYPDIKNIGIVYNASNNMAAYDIDYFKFYATEYGIDIYTVSINKPEDIDKALDNIMPKVDAIALVTDYMIDDYVSNIVSRASAENKVVFGDTDEHESKGAEVVTGRDYQLVGNSGAEIVKELIKDGKNVEDIKVKTVDFRVN